MEKRRPHGYIYLYIYLQDQVQVVFKILIEKKRGTNVPPEFINTNLSFTSHAGDAGAGPQVLDRQIDRQIGNNSFY